MNGRLFVLGLVLLMGLAFAVDVNSCQDITVSNYYRLTQDISVNNLENGTCINITANNVDFDMNGWDIYSPSPLGYNLSFGINVTGDNVTIRNGTIRDIKPIFNPIVIRGIGVVGTGSNLTVDNVDFFNDSLGVYLLQSQYHEIRNCAFFQVLGATLFQSVNYSYIHDNLVASIDPQPNFVSGGFFIWDTSNYNRFEDNDLFGTLTHDPTNECHGIYIQFSKENNFTNMNIDTFDIGVYIEHSAGATKNSARNLFRGMAFTGQMSYEVVTKGFSSESWAIGFEPSNFHGTEAKIYSRGALNISNVSNVPASGAGFPLELLGVLNITNTTKANMSLMYYYNGNVISWPTVVMKKHNGVAWSTVPSINTVVGQLTATGITEFSVFAAYGNEEPPSDPGQKDDELEIDYEFFCDGPSYVLNIIVTDEKTGEPVEGIEVDVFYTGTPGFVGDCPISPDPTLRGLGYIHSSAVTDADGIARFEEIAPGVPIIHGRYDIEIAPQKGYEDLDTYVCMWMDYRPCADQNEFSVEWDFYCEGDDIAFGIWLTDLVTGAPVEGTEMGLIHDGVNFGASNCDQEHTGDVDISQTMYKETNAEGFVSYTELIDTTGTKTGPLDFGAYALGVTKQGYEDYSHDFMELPYICYEDLDCQSFDNELDINVLYTCPDDDNVSCILIEVFDVNGDPVEGAEIRMVVGGNAAPSTFTNAAGQTFAGGANIVGGAAVTIGGGLAQQVTLTTDADGQLVMCSDMLEDGMEFNLEAQYTDPAGNEYPSAVVEVVIDFDNCADVDIDPDDDDIIDFEIPPEEDDGGDGTGEGDGTGQDGGAGTGEVQEQCGLTLEPSEIKVGETVTAWALADGVPCAGYDINVQTKGVFTTDEEGKITTTFENAGTYNFELLCDGEVCDKDSLPVVFEIEREEPGKGPLAFIEEPLFQRFFILLLIVAVLVAIYQYHKAKRPRKFKKK